MDEIKYAEELVSHYSLECASPNIFFGEYNNVPLSITILDLQPLSVLFKFKTINKKHPIVPLPEEFTNLKKLDKANLDFHGGYAWISFYDLTGIGLNALISCVEEIFSELCKIDHLTDDKTCFVCSLEKETSSVKFLDGEICRVCDGCLKEKIDEKDQLEKEANKGNPNFILILVPILIVSVSAWALFWLGLDNLLSSTGSKKVVVPRIVIVIVLGVASLIISYPLGIVVRKSGIFNVFPRLPLVILILLVTVLLGELFYLKLTLRVYTFSEIMFNFSEIIKFYGKDLLLHKLILIVTTGVGLNAFTQKVEKQIEF